MDQNSQSGPAAAPETHRPPMHRRDALKTIGTGVAAGVAAAAAGVTWAAPAILSVDAASAATSFAALQGTWVAQHTLAGSCLGITFAYQPFTPNGNATSWSAFPRSCGSLLVRTLFGIGSNGLGTIISVGDQNFRVRWTGCGATMANDSQAFSGSLNTYNDIAANGINWVAVGNSGRIRRSGDDGVNFAVPASQPGGAPALTYISHDHGTWIAGGGTIGLVWRSIDNGNNWANVSIGATSAIFQGATFDPVSGKWFVSGTLGEIWESNTDGLTWTLSTDTGADSWTEIDASPQGTIIAVAAGLGRMVRSTNGGATWNAFTMGGGTPAFNGIKTGITGTRQWMAVGLANQIWWSIDDGVTWMAASGLPSLRTWNDVTVCQVAD